MEPEGTTGGDLVARFLKSAGVAEVYGIPGGHTLGLNEAFERAGVPFLTFRHEYGAGCAAAAYGRVTSAAGVAMVTCGPGVTNAATAVAGALRDGNPMLLLAVNNREEHIGWGDAQEADAVAILAPISKWSAHVSRLESLMPTLHKAWRLAHSDRPGPVFIDIARDVVEGSAPDMRPRAPSATRAMVRAAGAGVAAAAEALRKAKRPAIWLGRGALEALRDGTLGRLVSHLEIPTICTFNAMEAAGAFDTSFGVLSRVGTRLSREIAEGSDLLLCLGNSLNGVSTKRWSFRLPEIVQVDVRPDRFSDRYVPTLAIQADVSSFCSDVLDALKSAHIAAWSEWRIDCFERRARWTVELHRAIDSASIEPIAPLALMGLFHRMGMDDGESWCIDASNAGIWAHVLNFRNGSRVLRPVNFSNMGYALGSAIGVARAGQAPVNVLVGDGSLAMSLGDLETVRRLDLPLRIFVLNDSSLSNIRQEVAFKYDRTVTAFDFTDVRFDRIAEGFGIEGIRVRSITALEGALNNPGPASGPRLFDIVVDGGPSVWMNMV